VKTTIFLRQPVGVAIHTEDYDTAEAALQEYRTALLAGDVIEVVSDKARLVIIPADNIASIEVQ